MKPEFLFHLVFFVIYIGCSVVTGAEESEDEIHEYVLIFKSRKIPQTDLECLQCYSGDATNDCMELKNISNIPTRFCREGEKYCKVQRIHTNGELTTFDRYCAKECEPGCKDAAIYHECVSCCNHESLCNIDNAAEPSKSQVYSHGFTFVLFLCSLHFIDGM